MTTATIGPVFAVGCPDTGSDITIPAGVRQVEVPLTKNKADPETATAAVLGAVLDWLHDNVPSGAGPDAVPIVLAAADHCVTAASSFVDTCLAGRRRIPPFASVRMESTQLLRRFVQEHDWHGPCFALVSPKDSGSTASEWAIDVVTAGQQRCVIVCEVFRSGPDADPWLLIAAAAVLAGDRTGSVPTPTGTGRSALFGLLASGGTGGMHDLDLAPGGRRIGRSRM